MEKTINLSQNLEGKPGEWEVHSGFEKLQHIHENQEDHTPVQDCIHTQESTEKALISHFWLTLIFSASKSYKLRQSIPLPVGTLKNIAHVHTELLGKSWKTQWFQTLEKNV